MLDFDDFKTFSQIGHAFWCGSEDSEQLTLETIAAASLLKLTSEKTIEQATMALLNRAKSTPSSLKNSSRIELLNHPFYRLTPEERLILISLHLGNWSYQRLSRILIRETIEIEELAWKARLQMCSLSSYPSGPSILGPHCPEYVDVSPWTQRFLDEQISSPKDKWFLQNHLVACDSCRKVLGRAREMYFKIDQEIKKLEGSFNEDFVHALKQTFHQSPVQRRLTELTFLQSLKIFTTRWDVRFGVFLLVAIVLFKFGILL